MCGEAEEKLNWKILITPVCTVCPSIYTHRDALGPFFILLRPVCFITQVQPAADSLVALLGVCSAVLVNLAQVFLIVEGRVACWTPPAPQAVKTLLTFSFVLYRPHLREAFDSSGDKRLSHVSGHAFPPRTARQLSRMPALASLCATGEFGGNIPPVPFGRSLAGFLGESQVCWVILTLSQGVVLFLAVPLPVGCSYLCAGPQ